MIKDSHLIELKIIEAIYEEAHDNGDWSIVMQLFCSFFRSRAAGFFEAVPEVLRENYDPIYIFDGLDDAVLRDYNNYYAAINPCFVVAY